MKKSKRKQDKVVIVMPAYNAEETLRKTYRDIPKILKKKIILVDDGSHDKTVKVAKRLGIKTFIHPQNRGYGANQKTCYTLAFNSDANIVVMIHPDYQYDSKLALDLIKPIIQGKCDVMLGSRMKDKGQALKGGMPVYKYIGNCFLTAVENIITNAKLSEYHTGFRAFHINVIKSLPFHRFSDDFVFDQEILISSLYSGFRVGEIGVPTRYFPKASSISFLRSTKYGVETLLCLIKYLLAKSNIYSFGIFKSNRCFTNK